MYSSFTLNLDCHNLLLKVPYKFKIVQSVVSSNRTNINLGTQGQSVINVIAALCFHPGLERVIFMSKESNSIPSNLQLYTALLSMPGRLEVDTNYCTTVCKYSSFFPAKVT